MSSSTANVTSDEQSTAVSANSTEDASHDLNAAAATGAQSAAEADEDADIAELRAKVLAMEEEQAEEQKRMNELSGAGGSASSTVSGLAPSNPVGSGAASKAVLTAEQIADIDSRSVHVAQVDYSVTEAELKTLFEACGTVNRVTILKDRFSGQPKGFAYVEFASADSIENAKILNDTEFKGRTLKITEKRTNIPGFGGRGGRGGRGRGGRGGPRGGFGGRGGYGPMRGGRGRGGFHPYQQSYQY